MKRNITGKLWIAMMVGVMVIGFIMPLASAEASKEGMDKETLFETVIILINETSLLGDDAIEDYSVREAELMQDESGETYWYVSFVKPSKADGESPRNIVYALSLDGRQVKYINVSPSEGELMMERFYKAIHTKGADIFILLSVNDQYDIAREFRSAWTSLPEDALSTDGYLHRTISKDYALPGDGDLSEAEAVQTASEALQSSGKAAHPDEYKIAVSFLRGEDGNSVWRVFFIANNAIASHPGYRVDVKNPDGTIAQIVDYGMDKDFFKHGYE